MTRAGDSYLFHHYQFLQRGRIIVILNQFMLGWFSVILKKFFHTPYVCFIFASRNIEGFFYCKFWSWVKQTEAIS